ncbi:ABC transporter ATP-binding protein [Glycomyces sp. NPDC049804]|uniref:ABC transporter ATP-binding protein n=1 Tax=Glycomyces sp. NPDC049804 TaxID=3154363 RepID=UPI00341F3067
MRPPMLTARALAKRFGTAPALDGVDFNVGPGESVAVTGPSGSGKSTLLHCLAGIMRPDSGEVRLFDERIDTLSERQRSHLRRTRFAFLFQFGQLLPELPADENVALPLMLGGTPRKAALEPARAELRRLGLAGKEDRRPGELSGGEAQRVALARALVVRPAVVFADEPTGALDRATGDQVMGVLLDTVRELDAALVVVTHDPRIAARCTRTIEIRDGRLSGTPRTGNGDGYDGFKAEPVAAGLRAGSAPQGASAHAVFGGEAPGSPAAQGTAGSEGAAALPVREARGGADSRAVRADADPVAFAAGTVPAATPSGGRAAPNTAVSAADTVARTVGSGGDAFASTAAREAAPTAAMTRGAGAPGGSGSAGSPQRPTTGPDFGPEPVVEVWR